MPDELALAVLEALGEVFPYLDDVSASVWPQEDGSVELGVLITDGLRMLVATMEVANMRGSDAEHIAGEMMSAWLRLPPLKRIYGTAKVR